MADPYKFSFDVAAFLEEQEVADTSVAPKEGVMKKPEAPVEEAPMSNTDRLKKRFADTVSSFYSGTQEIRDKYNKAQETNPLLGRDAAQNEWMTALSVPAVTTTALGPDMDTMAMQDAQEQAAIRSASGITESLGRPAPAGLGGAPAQPETPVIYEEGATVTNGADSVVDRTAPAGLMTRPVQGTVSEVDAATYSVASGDTLSKIAKANNTTVAELTAANPDIKDINKISVGQEIKLPTAPPVSDTTEAGTTESDRSGLLDFIGTGEGGYDSANRGTIGGNVIGSQMVASRGGKKVSELTVAEIKKYQSITDPNNKDRLFTVGKYQAIPDTFNQAVKGLGLPDDTVFTPEVQEKVGLYLVSEKRPKVGKFLRGEGDVTTNTAMLELAKEFASIPVPFSIPKGKYGKWPKTNLVAGDSFYKNPKASKGNRAGHTVSETRAVLEAAKR